MSVECREGRVATQRVATDRKKMGESRGGGVEARGRGYEPQSRWRRVTGETKRQEMTSGDVPVCRIPLLICFESTGCEKRGGIP